MVELQWARYKGERGTRYLLAFHLGVRDGKHVLLECRRVPDNEVGVLKALRPRLNSLSLEDRIALVKRVCPLATRLAYRTMTAGRYEVVEKY